MFPEHGPQKEPLPVQGRPRVLWTFSWCLFSSFVVQFRVVVWIERCWSSSLSWFYNDSMIRRYPALAQFQQQSDPRKHQENPMKRVTPGSLAEDAQICLQRQECLQLSVVWLLSFSLSQWRAAQIRSVLLRFRGSQDSWIELGSSTGARFNFVFNASHKEVFRITDINSVVDSTDMYYWHFQTVQQDILIADINDVSQKIDSVISQASITL